MKLCSIIHDLMKHASLSERVFVCDYPARQKRLEIPSRLQLPQYTIRHRVSASLTARSMVCLWECRCVLVGALMFGWGRFDFFSDCVHEVPETEEKKRG